jgi:hypothetical protein
MSRHQNALDRRPGSIPDIRTDVGGLTFVMRPRGTRNDERLVIRCDDEGEVWLSIQPDVMLRD